MPYSIEQKIFGLGKESVTRGTAAAPSVWLPVAKDTEMIYKLNLVKDEQVRDILEVFPSKAGIKDGTGKISGVDVDATNIGEILFSLMGKRADAQEGATVAYSHKFTKDSTVLQNQSYTFYVGRGLSAKQYSLGVVKSVAMKGTVDGKAKLDADVLFQTETTDSAAITPTWVDPTPFMFYNTQIKTGGSADITTIKDWNLTIDNQSFAKRVLNQSQDIVDVVTAGKLQVSGGFTAYFEDEARRTLFLAATSTTLEIICTGGAIATPYNYSLDINMPHILYTAYPFGEVDGLLGAAVTFDAYYDVATSETIDITLINKTTAY